MGGMRSIWWSPLVVLCLAGNARAQIGSGWVQYSPPSVLHLEVHDVIQIYPPDSTNLVNEGASYSNQDGIEIFQMLNTTSNRVERRLKNEYTSGRWQFEGEVRVSPPTDNESIMQIFGGTQTGATTQMIRAYADGTGTIRKVPGSVMIAANVWATWVKINVIHDVAADTVKTYANGKLMATGAGHAPGPWYHKYGCYGTVKTGTAKVECRNVKHFKDGTSPPGDDGGVAPGADGAVSPPDAAAPARDAGGAPDGQGAPTPQPGGTAGAGDAGGAAGTGGAGGEGGGGPPTERRPAPAGGCG